MCQEVVIVLWLGSSLIIHYLFCMEFVAWISYRPVQHSQDAVVHGMLWNP